MPKWKKISSAPISLSHALHFNQMANDIGVIEEWSEERGETVFKGKRIQHYKKMRERLDLARKRLLLEQWEQ